MRIMVTGGAGYIGSIITEELVKANHEVVVFDNLSKGHRAAVVAGARLMEGELENTALLKEIFTQHQIEAVIHMAASSLVGESVQNPRLYYRNNLQAGLKLLDTMWEQNIRTIVFSSTAAVYGEPAKQPIEENDPTDPTNPYGETKLAFENAMSWYSRAYGLRFTSLRYFNAAGATAQCGEDHDPESHLIPNVLQVAAGKKPHVEVFGDDYPTRDGTCVRDYIHVVDLARAHILALMNPSDRNRIYNLGCGGEGYSVREVIQIAREITQKEIAIRVTARRPGDPAVLIATSGRITKDLGWQPSFQRLELIVQSAWDWMVKHPQGYPA